MGGSHWLGRDMVIATMHGKEKVLGPMIQDHFGLSYFVPESFDTDEFGTFSGEIDRVNSPIETARLKCLKAMELAGSDLGLASEGSFGPHPELGFVSMNEEFLILIDKRNNWEIVAKKVSLDTNHAGQLVKNADELISFAERIGFPGHGLILTTEGAEERLVSKGITEEVVLLREFDRLKELSKGVRVETDMRAMFNPKRMAVIEQAGLELVSRMQSHCPECLVPGFGPVAAEPGLPCRSCSFPTASTLYLIRKCSSCDYSDHLHYPNKVKFEDPQYCNICNP